MNLSPQTVRFFVGTDATASWGGGPKDGDLYEVDAFYIHPDYESLMNINDIGLVHLASPLTSVESYPYNQKPDAAELGRGKTSSTPASG